MGNCLSKELFHNEPQGNNLDVIEMIKDVCKALLLAKGQFPGMIYNSKDQWSADRLKTTLDDVNKLCENWVVGIRKGRGE